MIEVLMAPFKIFPFLSGLFCPLSVYFNYIICENLGKLFKSFKYIFLKFSSCFYN